MPSIEPDLSPGGGLTLKWLLERLATNESLDAWEGPFGDASGLTAEQRVRYARYLAEYGERFVPAPLPRGIPGGTPYSCFANSTDFVCVHAIWRDDKILAPLLPEGVSAWDAEYVEGVCFNRKAPVLHAWAAFPGSQRVYDLTYGITDENDLTWEAPSRFHHYGETDSMAYVGVRVPREALLGLVMATRLLDKGMPSVLATPGALEALEAHPRQPGLALLRSVWDLLDGLTVRYAGRRGIGPVRVALKQIDREIRRLEGPFRRA